jgi:hypothetical protein
MIGRRTYQAGDLVVYRKTKHNPIPGPRATAIVPAPNGDNYTYNVDKFWIVDRIRDDGQLLIRTRTGKTHAVRPEDPNLRRAGVITRILYGNRFPAFDLSGSQPSETASSL